MKCLNCNCEMIKGTVEGVGQGAGSFYEFTADEEKKKQEQLVSLQEKPFQFLPPSKSKTLGTVQSAKRS